MNFLHSNVIKLLGEGGMGKVYLAEDTMLEKKVALKVLSLELSRDSQFIERFKRGFTIPSSRNIAFPTRLELVFPTRLKVQHQNFVWQILQE